MLRYKMITGVRSTMSLKRLLAVLLMLWLPIQTASAVVMPFCKHALQAYDVQQAQVRTPAMEHCAVHAGHKDSSAAAYGDNVNCGQCELCHLACAGFMPSSFAPLGAFRGNVAVIGIVARLHSVSSEPGDRPPMPVSL